MRLIRTSLFGAAALSLALGACGGDDGGGNNNNGGPTPLDPAGTDNTFVVSDIDLPTTQTESSALALNIDNDPDGNGDNQLGRVLAAIGTAAADLDLQGSIDDEVSSGGIILLANMQATALESATGAGLWVYLGDSPSIEPCDPPETDEVCRRHLNGDASFGIDAMSPQDALITGNITGGRFQGDSGTVTLELTLVEGTAPLRLNLIGAQADVRVDASGLMTGRLGGGITDDELQNQVLPALATVLQQLGDEDCQGTPGDCCTADSTGDLVYGLFDADENCEITLAEVRDNGIISTLVAPDVDLLDDDGKFAPTSGDSAVPDSLSLGIGFSGVVGSFPVPAR